jgi:hypothetical protein
MYYVTAGLDVCRRNAYNEIYNVQKGDATSGAGALVLVIQPNPKTVSKTS